MKVSSYLSNETSHSFSNRRHLDSIFNFFSKSGFAHFSGSRRSSLFGTFFLFSTGTKNVPGLFFIPLWHVGHVDVASNPRSTVHSTLGQKQNKELLLNETLQMLRKFSIFFNTTETFFPKTTRTFVNK